MSKGSLFWANARGKLGETVFYRAGGEQRNRTYVKNIKNPKTLAQAEQRLSMLNFASGYRALRELLEYSFPNRPSNLSGFNAFVKANKSVSFPVIDRAASEEGLAVLGDATVSSGNITTYGTAVRQAGFVDGDNPEKVAIGYVVPFPIDEDGSKNRSLLSLAANAPRNIIALDTPEKIKEVFSIFNLPADTKMVIVKGEYQDEGYKYEISTVDASGAKVSGIPAVGIISDKFEGEDSTSWITGSPAYLGVLTPTENEDETFYAVILSYKVGDKQDVTTSRLIPVGSGTSLTDQFRKGGFVYDQIMADYGPSKGNILTV